MTTLARWFRGAAAFVVAVAVFCGAAKVAQAQTTAKWLSATSGNWTTDTSLWNIDPYYPDNGQPAGATYDVLINATGSPYTISLANDISLDGFTLDSSDAKIDQTSGTFQIGGNGFVINAGTYNLDGATLSFQGSNQVLDGTGTLHLNGEASTGSSPTVAYDDLTVGNNMSIVDDGGDATLGTHSGIQLINHGTIEASGYSANLLISDGWQNQGIMRADGSTAILSLASGQNEGTIQAANGGTVALGGTWSNANGLIDVQQGSSLYLSGTFTPADIGQLQNSGNVFIDGTLDNTGNTFLLNDTTGSLTLNGGTIQGGTLQGSATNQLIADSGTLDSVQLNVPVTDAYTGNVTLHLTGSQPTVINQQFHIDGADVELADGTTLTGNGEILLSGTPGDSFHHATLHATSGGRFTIASGFTVQNDSEAVIGSTDSGFTNNGLIVVDSPNQALTLNGDWTNDGTIRLTAGTLRLDGQLTAASFNGIDYQGGNVSIAGTLDNSGNTLTMNQTTGSFGLEGTINGGRIETLDGTHLGIAPTSVGMLQLVTLAGDVQLQNGGHLNTNGDMTFDGGKIELFSDNSSDQSVMTVGFNGQAVAWSGSGELDFAGSGSTQPFDRSFSVVNIGAGGLTLGANTQISTTGGGGWLVLGGDLTNNGSIIVDTPNQRLTTYIQANTTAAA